MSVLISVEKVPKSLIQAEWGKEGDTPLGLTIYPTDGAAPFKGFRRIKVYVQEKKGQYLTRETICHELLHVAQYLCGCEVNEEVTHELEDILVGSMKEKKKPRSGT